MNKLLLFAVSLIITHVSRAQSLSEARRLIYYERYDGAAHQLHSFLEGNPINSEGWLLLTQVYIHQKRVPALRDSLAKMPIDVQQQPLGICAYG